MGEYTMAVLVSVVIVVGLELLVFRTGLFRRPAYWCAIGIAMGFQVPVDGWLTKLEAPIVRYAAGEMSGLRFPWDIPVEDFAFGFSLMTLTLTLWRWCGARDNAKVPDRSGSIRRTRASASEAPGPGR